jgi:uncharacterized surface protein with fasciclin (FAS1) repeats
MKLRNFLLAMFAIGGLSLFTSCDDEETIVTPPAFKSIVDVVVADANFSLLKEAVLHAGLDAALSDQKATLTVFAPTNQAFINAGFKDAAAIKAADKTVIGNILKYHVLGSKVAAADIKTADNQELTMLSTVKAYLTKNAAGVSINGAKVTSADVPADNGVIHVIDAVIVPPSKNLVEIVVGTPDLSLLKDAVLRASTGKTDVAKVLSGAGPFTVFAPTNAAFEKAGFNKAAIDKANPDDLAKILTYHVIAARVYSTNLKTGNVATAQGGNVAIDATNATVKGDANTTASKIIAVNITGTNGVAHLVDAVILPK